MNLTGENTVNINTMINLNCNRMLLLILIHRRYYRVLLPCENFQPPHLSIKSNIYSLLLETCLKAGYQNDPYIMFVKP